MHGEMRVAESARPAPHTPASMITEFRTRHRLTSEQLAALLDVEPETLRQYEALGSAPPWMAYALDGVAYEQFAVVPGSRVARPVSSEPPTPVVLPLHTPVPHGSLGGERVA